MNGLADLDGKFDGSSEVALGSAALLDAASNVGQESLVGADALGVNAAAGVEEEIASTRLGALWELGQVLSSNEGSASKSKDGGVLHFECGGFCLED